MILTAHQPQFIGGLRLYEKIMRSDTFCLFDMVQMERHSFVNRNRIKTANGTQWLTVPCIIRRENTIFKTLVDNKQDWRKKHKKTLEYAYKKAPYYDQKLIDYLYMPDFKYLVSVCDWTMQKILEALGIEVEWVDAYDYEFEGQKSDLVLDMATQLGADTYIFGAQGKNYCDEQSFRSAGVTPIFQEYEPQPYPQLWGEFVPDCCVLDLLFNVGAEKAKEVILAGGKY